MSIFIHYDFRATMQDQRNVNWQSFLKFVIFLSGLTFDIPGGNKLIYHYSVGLLMPYNILKFQVRRKKIKFAINKNFLKNLQNMVKYIYKLTIEAQVFNLELI